MIEGRNGGKKAGKRGTGTSAFTILQKSSRLFSILQALPPPPCGGASSRMGTRHRVMVLALRAAFFPRSSSEMGSLTSGYPFTLLKVLCLVPRYLATEDRNKL